MCAPLNVEWPRFALHGATLVVGRGEHVGRLLIAVAAVAAWMLVARALQREGARAIRSLGGGAMAVLVGLMGAWATDGLVRGDFWSTGFSSAGAVLVAALALAAAGLGSGGLLCRVADRLAAIGLVVLGMLRLGCVADGCDYGRVSEQGWGVRYVGHDSLMRRLRESGNATDAAAISPILHPYPLYELLGLCVVAGLIVACRRRLPRPGDRAFVALAGWAVVRLGTEPFRGNIDAGEVSTGTIVAVCVLLLVAMAAAVRRRLERSRNGG